MAKASKTAANKKAGKDTVPNGGKKSRSNQQAFDEEKDYRNYGMGAEDDTLDGTLVDKDETPAPAKFHELSPEEQVAEVERCISDPMATASLFLQGETASTDAADTEEGKDADADENPVTSFIGGILKDLRSYISKMKTLADTVNNDYTVGDGKEDLKLRHVTPILLQFIPMMKNIVEVFVAYIFLIVTFAQPFSTDYPLGNDIMKACINFMLEGKKRTAEECIAFINVLFELMQQRAKTDDKFLSKVRDWAFPGCLSELYYACRLKTQAPFSEENVDKGFIFMIMLVLLFYVSGKKAKHIKNNGDTTPDVEYIRFLKLCSDQKLNAKTPKDMRKCIRGPAFFGCVFLEDPMFTSFKHAKALHNRGLLPAGEIYYAAGNTLVLTMMSILTLMGMMSVSCLKRGMHDFFKSLLVDDSTLLKTQLKDLGFNNVNQIKSIEAFLNELVKVNKTGIHLALCSILEPNQDSYSNLKKELAKWHALLYFRIIAGVFAYRRLLEDLRNANNKEKEALENEAAEGAAAVEAKPNTRKRAIDAANAPETVKTKVAEMLSGTYLRSETWKKKEIDKSTVIVLMQDELEIMLDFLGFEVPELPKKKKEKAQEQQEEAEGSD